MRGAGNPPLGGCGGGPPPPGRLGIAGAGLAPDAGTGGGARPPAGAIGCIPGVRLGPPGLGGLALSD